MSTADFHTLNRCLDNAIAGAVTMFMRESQQSRFEEAADRSDERVGFLVHELRNLVNTATVAFEVLKTGSVGASGNTGAVLNRSLGGLRDLIARSLNDVRLTHSVKSRKRIVVSELIKEVEAAATLAAHEGGIILRVIPVEEGVAIDVDRQVLSAVLMNLLQNALKFTRPRSTVTLRVGASADRVLIEIQDECGGLPAGDVNELFRPFEQRGADRTGMGIGLAFSRWGAEANGGRLYARNLPDKGCVFIVDLPRSPVPDVALA
jgi:signal transduction histidine kinase